jgi:porphobilinogen deaminase
MDLVPLSVNFEASKDKTILAQRDSRHAVRQSLRAARFPAITPMRDAVVFKNSRFTDMQSSAKIGTSAG